MDDNAYMCREVSLAFLRGLYCGLGWIIASGGRTTEADEKAFYELYERMTALEAEQMRRRKMLHP